MLLQQGVISLAQRGYHGTGIKEVLDAVGVPKGSFYNYFPSKEAFVAAVIDRYSNTLLEAWDEFFTTYDGPVLEGIRTAYETVIVAYEAGGYRQGCLLGALAAEIADESELCRGEMISALDQWKRRFVVQVERGQGRGEIRNDLPAREIAEMFWDAWEGSILRMKVEKSAEPLRRTLRLMLGELVRPRT